MADLSFTPIEINNNININTGNILTIDQLPEQTTLSKLDWIITLSNTSKKTGKASFVKVIELLKGDFYTKTEIINLLKQSDSKFDWNRPITTGPYAGVTPGGDTVAEGLENLFYDSLAPLCALDVVNPVREYGASTAITLQYSTQQRTKPITQIVVDGAAVTAPSGTVTTSTGVNQNKTWYMSVTDGTKSTTDDASVYFKHRRFWFKSANDLTSYTDADLSSFLNNVETSELADGRGQGRTFTVDNEYIYFAWLGGYGQATFVVNNSGDTDFIQKTFNYTNAFGYTTQFILVRKGTKLKNTFSVVVN